MIPRPPALALAAAALVALSARSADAQHRELFNALRPYRPTPVRAADEAVVRRDALPVVRRLWARVPGCREDFRVVDAGYGAFTDWGMSQRAVLYRFCQTGDDAAMGGVAIVQAGRVVAHFTVEGPEPDGIRRLPDVDRNRLAELVLVDNAGHQGESTVAVSIVQLVPGGVQAMGTIRVYNESTGARLGMEARSASVLAVMAGPRPVFELETYEHPAGSRAMWVGSEKPHPITLPRDPATYRRLR